jgi:aryl-alcohol dehydrogenase-like predicted oxidoreductase
MALAWCYSRWFVASTIIGATKLAQLKENIDAADITLPDHVVSAIDAIHARLPNPGQ